MTTPIAVIVPAFNAAPYLREALASVYAQTMRPTILTIVNDGSEDGTGELADILAAEAPADIEVRVIHQSNRGLAASRNRALAREKAERILLLDADDVLDPSAIEKLTNALERTGTSGIFPLYRWVDEVGASLNNVSRPPSDAVSLRTILLDNPLHSDSGVLLKRSAIEAVGGFDETLSGYVGLDFWTRFAATHGKGALACLPEDLVLYRRHSGQITSDWQRMLHNGEALLRKLHGLYPDQMAPLARPAAARQNLLAATIAYQQGEYAEARRLCGRAVMADPSVLASRADARSRVLACLASLLPTPMHVRLRRRFG